MEKVLDTVVDIHNTGEKGDILIFLATCDETEKACADIKRRFSNSTESITPLSLHDDLQEKDIQNIFSIDSSGRRKIIFTTWCAETSMTIPGIRYIIDTGLIKERIYDEKSNCYSQRVHSICQSSAIQRCGRAEWRAEDTQSGVCYRLYSQQDYDDMSQLSQPEIKRADLSNVFLKMIELGVTNIIKFKFIQSPPLQNITNSLDTLCKLSAITVCTPPLRLTSKGKLYCKLPLEPRLSALIMNANEWDILPEGMVVAAALSMSCNLNCRYGSEEDKSALDVINTEFRYSDGDVISTAEVYVKWRSRYRRKDLRGWCYKNKINWKLMQQLDYKVRQLEQSLLYADIINRRKLKIPSQLKSQSCDKLKQLIFQCYRDQLAVFTGSDNIGYITAYSDNQYLIHKSSTLFSLGVNPKFVVYRDILTTWDNFLINVTPVDEEWLQSTEDYNSYAEITDASSLVITQTIDNIGSVILSEYDAKTIDKIVKSLLHDEKIRCTITKNVKGSNLQMTTIKSKMPRLTDVINESITLKKEKLTKAIKTLCRNDDSTAPRLIIGSGIIVKDILLSDDSVEFKITLRYTGHGSPEDNTVTNAINEVQALIMSCGELAVDIDSASINKSKDCKYIRFDKIVYQEIISQSLLKQIDMQTISGYEINVEKGSLANCNISRGRILVQFRWPRRPRNGTASITCRNNLAAIEVESNFPLTICNQTIYAGIDRYCASKLYLRQIPNFVTAADIRMAIPLADREAMTEIYFHRVAAASINDDISSSELEATLKNVLDKNGYFGKYSKVTIKPLSSVKRNLNIIADVIFCTYNDAISAVRSLNDGVHEELINEPISVRLGHSRIIKCQPEIYACLDREIDRVRESVQNNTGDQEQHVHIKIDPSSKKYPLTSIAIRSWNESSFNQVVRRISNIIEPARVRIDVTEILDYLNSRDGRYLLTSLHRHFTVYAKIDWKSQCIFIYGVKEMKEQALLYCQKEIDMLLSKCNIINLVGNDKPRDFVKVVIKRYGINMNELRQISGAKVVRLNRKNKTLIVIGEEESYANILSAIDSCCNKLDASKMKSNDEISANDCVACFCEVDDDNYRLQYCGHLYCQECIIGQIDSAIKSTSFPLTCASCNEGFVIEDLERLLTKSPQPRLFDVLLTEFIRRNPDVWHYCPTPECESVYKRSQSNEVFTCPECQHKTCRGCDTEGHPGYDCNQIKLIRNDDVSIQTFMEENSERVKKCPGCKAAIEKNAGCNHMECPFCHTHFCWLCLAGYKTSGECYKHLQDRHGGCFDYVDY